MKLFAISAMAIASMLGYDDCSNKPSSDDIQRQQQETLLKEGTSQIGMPNIVHFRERKLLKDILELRDQMSLNTYTYIWNDFHGKKVFICNSIGYGIPYATQFTNPQKTVAGYQSITTINQADPNGLFSPPAAEGTWVMCKDPKSDAVKPVYFEPRIIVSPFELPNDPGETATVLPKK